MEQTLTERVSEGRALLLLRGDECRHVVLRDRFAKQIPLDVRATECGKRVSLCVCLDALRDDLRSERMRERDDRANDLGFGRRIVEPTHERTIDLQDVDLKLFEIAQRRVAGAEIIQREFHAERAGYS